VRMKAGRGSRQPRAKKSAYPKRRKKGTESGNNGLNTRKRVLKAAAELFARRGYHATSVRQLSSAVRLGRGALYYHIKGKERLLWDILWEPARSLADKAVALRSLDVPPDEKLRLFGRNLMRGIADDLAEWTVFFREFHGLSRQRLNEVLRLRETFEAVFREILEAGYAQGQFRKPDPLLVKGLLGMFNYSYVWIRPHGSKTPEEIADEFCDAILQGIRVSPARSADT
jgi:AcrR family transcriptional regulator